MCRHLLARCHSFKSEFRQAVEHEKEVARVYRGLFGENSEKYKGMFLLFFERLSVSVIEPKNGYCKLIEFFPR